MHKKFHLIILLIVFCATNTLYSQDGKISVSGNIMEDPDMPLPGVSVIVKGTSTGTVSGLDGEFKLDVSPGATIIFSFLGYETQEIKVSNSRTNLNIILKSSSKILDETVIVGYGTQSRRTLTSSVTKVGGEAIENIPITAVGDGLKGKMAGVRVHSNNNTPGADPSFTIRGGSSINKTNAPLVLIDGVERELSGVNPNDVESIEVLKDAASTAIYGARASNGVVLITTKKGTRNSAPRITFDLNFALQQAESKIDLMNARDYINTVRPAVAVSPYPKRNDISGFSASSGNDANSLYSTRYLNDGETIPAGYQSMVDPLDPTKTLIFQDNNMQDLLYRTTTWQNYYVGIDGGTESMRYSASIGYLDDDGIARGTGYTRMSAKANTDIQISRKLSATMGFVYSRTTSNQFSSQMNEISRALANPSTQKLYYEDGTPTPGYNAASPNPLWTEHMKQRDDQRNIVSLFGEINYFILENLKANVQASYYNNTYDYDAFEKANEFNGLRPVTSRFQKRERTKIDGYLTYNKTLFNRHNLSAMAGFSYQKQDYKEFSASADGGSSDKIPTLSASPNKKSADSKYDEIALAGAFGRLTYDFDKKYLFSATFRQDGSSLFAKGHRWGFFPGASVGWIMSEETFMKNIPVINFLKWRVSYGQTGNNNIGMYDALGSYAATSQYNGASGITPSKMPNNDLKWETTTQLDAGFDISLLRNRISLRVDYFNKITDDLLFTKKLPNTAGFGSVEMNLGKVRFRGFDIELVTRNIDTKDFTWESKINWSYVKNKVLRMPDNGNDRNREDGIRLDDGTMFGGRAEGESLYGYYGYKVEKILQNDEEAANARYDEQANGWSITDNKREKGRKSPGDYEWVDRDGDGKITAKDVFKLGVTVPHTTGGLNNSFRYKDFSLNIFLDWAIGHSINDNSYMRYFMNTFSYNYALAEDVKKCWKQEGDNTKYARFTPDDPNDGNRNFTRTSNVFNYKGDYLCIRDISLQYHVPAKAISKLGMHALTITLSGSNLHYFTAVKGISPEVGTSSTYSDSYNNYPATRRYALGIKATF
ncbi:TonB-dependent receptor [Dysgonomonas sp. 520]|uniref:SusC/RagA family TonB-linked outer membrane protein n=1 Tax=Dysgonomonas sp. 520 TaxID=2302931 RepID=UPI0013D315E4|nr:TonB-dependent receptor [Dysgonomonas sp. 520]NDW08561.1 TonB-dependent receptor [Dysgonomonas sp. 520]